MNDSQPAQRSTGGPTAGPAQSTTDGGKPTGRDVDPRQRPLVKTVVADARIAAAYRGERHEFRSLLDGVAQALRLMLKSDAFLALTLYRLKARLQGFGIPILPWIAHRLAMVCAQVSIADTAVVHPGVFIPHGQVVVSGHAEISPGVSLSPWVTVAPIADGAAGPRIGPWARIGTGAKVMGDIEIGAYARVGVNAVALDDVPPNTTAVGMPAKPVTE